jgi:trk system potassium uptake protein TrkA
MHVIIVGCGRVGAHAAAALARQGHSVVVVDRDPRAFHRLPRNFAGTRVLGIGYDKEILEKAGISRADAFVSVTNGDNTNIVSARVAKEVYRVPIVVSRIYDPQRAEIYRRFGVMTFAPTVWGAGKVLEMVTSGQLARDFVLGNGEVEVLSAAVPAHLVGKPTGVLGAPGEIALASIIRMGKAMIPVSGTRFEQGDQLHVLVHQTAVDKFQKMMGLK